MQSKSNTGVRNITKLSDGWYMVEPCTKPIARLLYARLDDDELDELKAVGMTEEEFVKQFSESDRSAAFFNCSSLMFAVSANWVDFDGKKRRLWDTMSTDTVRREGFQRAFVKHTQEMIDAFAIGEPTDVFIGVCKSDFERSRKWIEKVAKFKELGHIGLNNVWHTVYEYTWNKEK